MSIDKTCHYNHLFLLYVMYQYLAHNEKSPVEFEMSSTGDLL